jgi:hypothetical protein
MTSIHIPRRSGAVCMSVSIHDVVVLCVCLCIPSSSEEGIPLLRVCMYVSVHKEVHDRSPGGR